MDAKELHALLSLTLIFPTASPLLIELLDHCEDISGLYEDIRKNRSGKLYGTLKEYARQFDPQLAEDIISYCAANGIHIVTIYDDIYPELLRSISCPPVILYCKGDITALSQKYYGAIVGARKADDYSVRTARQFSEDFVRSGVVVVSGCAYGVDSAAHTAALEAGGRTIAVLGCGIDYDYPKGKMPMKNEICKKGLLISEYPPLHHSGPDNFTVRNRIISGLSHCVLVVQADKKSGSLNTASHAIDQGRDVYVIPPANILSDKYAGQVELLRDGAQMVFTAEDISILV